MYIQVNLSLAVAIAPQTTVDGNEAETKNVAPIITQKGKAPMFVRAQETEPERAEVCADNPDEIQLPSEDDEEEEQMEGHSEEAIENKNIGGKTQNIEEDVEVGTRAIPEEVFGSLKPT